MAFLFNFVFHLFIAAAAATAAKLLQLCPTLWPHRRQPTRPHCPWDSPGKNTGVGCHFLLQCMKVKSESEVAQSCPTLSDPMDCSRPGSSIHGIFQARVLEWGAIAFSYSLLAYRKNLFFFFYSLLAYRKTIFKILTLYPVTLINSLIHLNNPFWGVEFLRIFFYVHDYIVSEEETALLFPF